MKQPATLMCLANVVLAEVGYVVRSIIPSQAPTLSKHVPPEKAALWAKLPVDVPVQWLRPAHVMHALNRGVLVPVVRARWASIA